MKLQLQDYKLVLFILLCSTTIFAQNTVSGTVTSENNIPLQGVQVFNDVGVKLAITNSKGRYQFFTTNSQIQLTFYLSEYQLLERVIQVKNNTQVNITLQSFSEKLSEVEITAQKRKVFQLIRLKDVHETAIYAGKKSEVVLVSESTANLATNNARQIYSQVAGLNIFQNDDAGLQLNIGGRGLDPNRTSNFNTRQNGYDISADVLGYPESYYTPPAEALEEIQIVRGAASLQYGTQFGGLVNFVMKKPNSKKSFEFLSRNTLGNANLFTNFTSISGTKKKFSYYTYYNYKQGDGFRPNSEFSSKNTFAHIGYQFTENTKVEAEVTYLTYLAQQAGGLTTAMFEENPFQSNRARNWFEVDWLLYNLKFAHRFTENTNVTFNFFGLNAQRKALGFRDRRVFVADNGEARDLILGDFKNFGFEARLLDTYTVFTKKAIFLVGAKFYKADNSSLQGPGTAKRDADFSLALNEFPFYRNQSKYQNPNLNIAVFGENIFYLNNKWSITPGIRFEYLKTGANGSVTTFNFDGAGNPLDNGQITTSNITNQRSFALLGVGISYKPNKSIEFYGNISQNYRSVTFSDMNLVNPVFFIDPTLQDEKGFTTDLGIRGNYKKKVSFDIGMFSMFYKDKIGSFNTTVDGFFRRFRTNIGDARVVGVEGIVDFNLKKIVALNNNFSFNYFVNTSFLNSEYTKVNSNLNTSEVRIGNKLQFVPAFNLKTGIRFGYKNLLTSLQYTYLSEQFTDAQNSPSIPTEGVLGTIPAYNVLDFSAAYTYKMFKIETGINNVLNHTYFTRRATGYPGPGIIPSAPRNWYVTLQFRL